MNMFHERQLARYMKDWNIMHLCRSYSGGRSYMNFQASSTSVIPQHAVEQRMLSLIHWKGDDTAAFRQSIKEREMTAHQLFQIS